ncbi:hypothetical protein [Sediminibacillus albus]|uniref:hypothetical protein n=1 Tax=Sediminibacillus albus TaxID=407036 RepID=UPI001FDED26F|nr:hypothetical protein [Sediminibacillus albus]
MHLFLFGGSPPFTPQLAKIFAGLARNSLGKIAILFLEREGWQAYMPKYTTELEKHGLKNFLFFPLQSNVSESG